jgi:hypothetical protein
VEVGLDAAIRTLDEMVAHSAVATDAGGAHMSFRPIARLLGQSRGHKRQVVQGMVLLAQLLAAGHARMMLDGTHLRLHWLHEIWTSEQLVARKR